MKGKESSVETRNKIINYKLSLGNIEKKIRLLLNEKLKKKEKNVAFFRDSPLNSKYHLLIEFHFFLSRIFRLIELQ